MAAGRCECICMHCEAETLGARPGLKEGSKEATSLQEKHQGQTDILQKVQDYFQGNPYRSHKALPAAQKPLQSQKNVSTVPFMPSSPSKRIGGMKAGTFDVYPSHSADPYVIRRSKPANQEPVFRPAPGPKSTPVKSIISVNVNRRISSANYRYTTIPAVMKT
ncbi:cilia-and flagella-associated protein 96 [Xiphophorus hellerii]|uniref:cilia-and flagella-associated protein 96 n=1 Tax=Xiphophorus hellerii TaxID=8084 RepID=UPI0013B45F81|nr:UPF0602 protein C4orf47 homolog [Xiphophorus hellerii]